jgi:hypothetical protein
MAFGKVSKAPRTGAGALVLDREERAVAFSVLFADGQGAKRGGKGSITADAEVLRQAFRSGECRLVLDDGVALRIAVIAHTDGGDTAYFELR